MSIKKIFTIACLATSALYIQAADHCSKSLNIVSYNVRNGIGIDNVNNLSRTISTLRSTSPEIVCLQELDSVTGRMNQRYVLGELADSLNMHPSFAPAINFMDGKYGIGLLSQTKPISTKIVPLPGREEARTLLIAEFPEYVIACTHLSLTPDDQLLSIPIIEKEAEQWSKPFILAGDLNTEIPSATIDALNKSFVIISQTETPTHPSDKPQDLIDYILIDKAHAKEIKVTEAKAITGTIASDHIPQFITIELKCNKKCCK